jgi:hypothetical protein
MGNKAPDRKIEKELLEFTELLKKDMDTKDVLSLYEELEKEHWVAESKIFIMRTIFHAILAHQEPEEPFGPPTGAFA